MSAGAAWQPTDFQPIEGQPKTARAPAKGGAWQPTEFQPEKPAAPVPQQPTPGFGNRYSEVTLGTQHPVDQAASEWESLKEHPVDTLIGAAKTAGMMPVNLAYNAVHHPIDTITGLTGGPQFAEDLEKRNYAGMAGDVAGGLTNTLLAKKGVEALPDVAEGAASGMNSAGVPSDYPEKIGNATRQENGNLRPIVRAGSRAVGAAGGYALGGGGGAVAGGLMGPSLADALLPDRAPTPAPVVTDQFGLPKNPEGWSVKLPNRMPKIGGSSVTSQLGEGRGEEGIAILPEPRALFQGEEPNYMASVPRDELDRLAKIAKPGAGKQLQQLGRPVLYKPRGVE